MVLTLKSINAKSVGLFIALSAEINIALIVGISKDQKLENVTRKNNVVLRRLRLGALK